MKTLFTFLALMFTLILTGCKKSKDLTIKFEVTTTSPVSTPYPGIITKTGLSNSETSTDFTSGTIWTKVFTTDTEKRPITISMNAQNVTLSQAGSVTTSIYVNEIKQATSTSATTLQGSLHMANTTPISYTID